MKTVLWILVWITCVVVGSVLGWFAGELLERLGFVVIGGAVKLVGAGVGGIVVLLGFMSWWNRRGERRATS